MANHRQRGFGQLVLLTLVLVAAPAANGESPRSALNRIIEDRMTASEPSYGEQMAACERIAADRAGPDLNAGALLSLGATRRQVVNALGYLHTRNQWLCERAIRTEGVLKDEVFDHLQSKRGMASGSRDSIHDRLHGSDYRHHQLAAHYRDLPAGLRRHLEERVGYVPFDLTRAIEAAGYER